MVPKELKNLRRRQQRKRHTDIELALLQTFSFLFHLVQFAREILAFFFWIRIPKDCFDNHGQKSWDTFAFLGRFPIHTGPILLLTPQTMLDACIENFFPSFNFVKDGGRENCKKIRKRCTDLRGNREMIETYE